MNTSHLAEGALGSVVTVLGLHGLLSVPCSVSRRSTSGAMTAFSAALWLGAQAPGQRCLLAQPTMSRTSVPDCPLQGEGCTA